MRNKPGKIRIGIIFGGRSGEHEVSLVSARSIMAAIDKVKYEVVPIGITKQGAWITAGDPMKQLTESAGAVPPQLSQALTVSNTRELIPGTGQGGIPQLDVIFPVLHGPFGEDGTIQGLLELADLPYVGCGVLGSAVGMDKAIAKALFRDAGLPTAPDIVVLRKTWEEQPRQVAERVAQEIGYPCFVKPANLGSSVGISKAHGPDELEAAMNLATAHDRKVLIEEALVAREIECSVLGNDEPVASVLGEIVPKREFYDYQAKYGDEGTDLIIPADLPPALAQRIREMAVTAFRTLELSGLARVDFFVLRDSGQVYINEVNTLPGFTSISMYPKLWEASGLPYSELIDRLVDLAFERYADKQRTLKSLGSGDNLTP